MSTTKTGSVSLAVGALGIVFGDIGTSPLYAMHAVFGAGGRNLAINQVNVFGIISLIIWSITLVVSIKFILFIMSAGNKGEGGILALTTLIKNSRTHNKYIWLFILLGVIGVSLFYGDSIITPAISVLSAVEGVKVVSPHLSYLVIPTTLAIIVVLFWLQKYGTGLIGKLFGPVMALWFIVIGLGGLDQTIKHPGILRALSPLTAINFFVDRPFIAFVSMTAVVLAITGAEALYADMGHFGRPAIAQAWFYLVFPALILCYMGQGAILLHNPDSVSNTFISLFPSGVRIPIILLSTLATIIASQAVISGAFSLTAQAIQLEFLPKMRVLHTSDYTPGQIYLPFVNFAMFLLVTTLVLLFKSSASLSNAYGIAVSGTLAADTILFLAYLKYIKHKSLVSIAVIGFIFIPIDALFLSSNSLKIFHGGLFPILIGVLVFIIINTWTKGERIIDSERHAMEGPLKEFVEDIYTQNLPLRRIPGTAIFIGHHSKFVPLAFRDMVLEQHELPEKSVVVTVNITPEAHVTPNKRFVFDNLGHVDGISHVLLQYGYHDVINVPKTMEIIDKISPELSFDIDQASYFVSLTKVVQTKRHNLAKWRKSLYCLLYRNALIISDYYKLPVDRTEEISTPIEL